MVYTRCMNESPENSPAEQLSPEEIVKANCKEILGEDFSTFEKSTLVNRYTGQTKADEIREALESYDRVKDTALSDVDIEDLNSIMYLEEIREKKELEAWKKRGVNINSSKVPNIYEAMEINQKVTAGEYLKSIPQIIVKLGEGEE